jgi:hypothetical protein
MPREDDVKIHPSDYVATCVDCGTRFPIPTRILERTYLGDDGEWHTEHNPPFVPPREPRCLPCGNERHIARARSSR